MLAKSDLKNILIVQRIIVGVIATFCAGCAASGYTQLLWPLEASEACESVWLSDHAQVCVVFLSKDGCKYKSTYDVREESFCVEYRYGLDELYLCQPALDFLRDQFLLGTKLKVFKQHQCVENYDFGIKDVNFDYYNKHSFVSASLCEFLQEKCPGFVGEDTFWEYGWRMLSEAVLQSMIPPKKIVEWSIVDEATLEYHVHKQGRKRSEIFMIVQGQGILRGVFKRNLFCWCSTFPRGSALFRKMVQARGVMVQRYGVGTG